LLAPIGSGTPTASDLVGSYAGHGSVHAEFMAQNGFPNPGTAQASVITCNMTPGK